LAKVKPWSEKVWNNISPERLVILIEDEYLHKIECTKGANWIKWSQFVKLYEEWRKAPCKAILLSMRVPKGYEYFYRLGNQEINNNNNNNNINKNGKNKKTTPQSKRQKKETKKKKKKNSKKKKKKKSKKKKKKNRKKKRKKKNGKNDKQNKNGKTNNQPQNISQHKRLEEKRTRLYKKIADIQSKVDKPGMQQEDFVYNYLCMIRHPRTWWLTGQHITTLLSTTHTWDNTIAMAPIHVSDMISRGEQQNINYLMIAETEYDEIEKQIANEEKENWKMYVFVKRNRKREVQHHWVQLVVYFQEHRTDCYYVDSFGHKMVEASKNIWRDFFKKRKEQENMEVHFHQDCIRLLNKQKSNHECGLYCFWIREKVGEFIADELEKEERIDENNTMSFEIERTDLLNSRKMLLSRYDDTMEILKKESVSKKDWIRAQREIVDLNEDIKEIDDVLPPKKD